MCYCMSHFRWCLPKSKDASGRKISRGRSKKRCGGGIRISFKEGQRGQKGQDAKRRAPRIDGVFVQQMASRGTETIVGLTRVARVGALVMFGMGGIYVEVMRDVVLRLVPLLDSDADAMVREVKMVKLLEGVRGQKPRDLAALADVILRLSQLAERHPQIAEMDINPLLATEHGVLAVDARVQLGAGA